MKKQALALAFTIAALFILLSMPTFAEDKVTIAIMPVKEGQLSKWWGWDWDLEAGVTNLVTDELVKRNKLNIVERSRLEEIMDEQDLADNGRVEDDTAAQIGKLLGARLMVMSTITEWDFKQSGGIGISFLRVSGSQAKVKLTGRLVDTETGRILASFQGEGSKIGTSFSVDSYRGVSLDGEQFEGSTLGQATEIAIKQYCDELIKAAESVSTTLGKAQASRADIVGTVQAVLGSDMFVVDIGTKNGITKKDSFNISRLQTVKGLKNPVKVPIGTATILSLEDEAAVLKVATKAMEVAEGDVVTLK